MSIETFFSQHKPDSDFKFFIQQRLSLEEEQKGHTITPLMMLAQLYRLEGSERIQTITRQLSESEGSKMTVPNYDILLKLLTNQEAISWGSNSLAIYFGCTIPTIYLATKEGWLDMSIFWGLYDLAKAGTYLPEYHQKQTELDILKPSQWGALDQAVRNNPNYAIFLEQKGLGLLPSSLASILRNPYKTYESILPQFKKNHILLAIAL